MASFISGRHNRASCGAAAVAGSISTVIAILAPVALTAAALVDPFAKEEVRPGSAREVTLLPTVVAAVSLALFSQVHYPLFCTGPKRKAVTP